VFGEASLFETAKRYPFVVSHLPLYALLTLLLALIARLFVRGLRETERLSQRFAPWSRAALGGLGVGILATTLALIGDQEMGMAMLGGGYGAAQAAITGASWLDVGLNGALTLLLLAFAKTLASCLTIGTGGSAGALGPSFVIGGLVGGAFGLTLQTVLDDPTIQPGAFALVGMGTLYGGIAHTPLGTLVMVCEMAGSYDLLVPLMLSGGIAFVVMRRTSIHHSQPRMQQDSPAHPPRVVQLLAALSVGEVMGKHDDFMVFAPGTPVPQVFRGVSETSWQDVFPVIDADGVLRGMITPELLRVVAAEQEMAPWLVAADAMQPPVTVAPEDNLRVASERMLSHGLRELMVVDDQQRIVGFIDEAEIGQTYLSHLE
jgi:CIC family chloride channel protein